MEKGGPHGDGRHPCGPPPRLKVAVLLYRLNCHVHIPEASAECATRALLACIGVHGPKHRASGVIDGEYHFVEERRKRSGQIADDGRVRQLAEPHEVVDGVHPRVRQEDRWNCKQTGDTDHSQNYHDGKFRFCHGCFHAKLLKMHCSACLERRSTVGFAVEARERLRWP